MGKKRSTGVTILGWGEIILGGIGTAIFILFTISFIYCLFHPAQTEIGAFISLATMIIFLPAHLFLWAGIGVIKVKSWGRKMNIFVITILISLLVIFFLIFHLFITGKQFMGYLLIEIPVALLLALPLVFFFNRPDIKEQFKGEEK